MDWWMCVILNGERGIVNIKPTWSVVLIDFTIPDVPISCARNFFRLASFNLDLLEELPSLNMDGNWKGGRECTSFAWSLQPIDRATHFPHHPR